MSESEFWRLIEAARRDADDNCAAVADALVERISRLPEAEIRSFDQLIWAKLDESYTRPLWGAAYLINGGCSDDGFEYFRGWLISQGSAVFQAAVAQPDSLADVVRPGDAFYECEDVLGVAHLAYEKATGTSMPVDPRPLRGELVGDDWDFDDDEEMAQRLPRLSKMFDADGT